MITSSNLKRLEDVMKEMGILSITAATKDGGVFYDEDKEDYVITGLNIKMKESEVIKMAAIVDRLKKRLR